MQQKLKNPNFSNYKVLILDSLKDKYPYLLTGIVVLILLFVSVLKMVQNKSIPLPKNNIRLENLEDKTVKTAENTAKTKTYIVKSGDHLWKIAEENYGSGYNAYDIAKTNNIENPSLIFSGQKLIIPSVEPKLLTKGETAGAQTAQVTKKVDKYVVETGDNLWNIAQSVYGDGYAWVKIAKVNNIANPDIIFKGQVLKIE